MKKIIVAFDGLRFSESAKEYAIYLAKKSNAHLVGVFLDDFMRHSYRIYDLVTSEGHIEAKQHQLEEKDIRTRAESVENFETACKKVGLEYSVHHDKNVALRELLHESIYADLLVIDSTETLTSDSEKIPSEFITDLLSNVQCPALVVPHEFKPITRLVMLYDGEPTSMNAIKMFGYLMVSLKHETTEIVSVKKMYETLHVPDNHLMKEFTKRHFPDASFRVLKGFPEIEIVNYLKSLQETSLVVLGAYQRGMVSRWFRASMADVLMRDLKLPLFISHNNR